MADSETRGTGRMDAVTVNFNFCRCWAGQARRACEPSEIGATGGSSAYQTALRSRQSSRPAVAYICTDTRVKRSLNGYKYHPSRSTCPNKRLLEELAQNRLETQCDSHKPGRPDLPLARRRPHLPWPVVLQEDVCVAGQDANLTC